MTRSAEDARTATAGDDRVMHQPVMRTVPDVVDWAKAERATRARKERIVVVRTLLNLIELMWMRLRCYSGPEGSMGGSLAFWWSVRICSRLF